MSSTDFDPRSKQLLCWHFIASGQWDHAWGTAQDWLNNDPQNAHAHQCAGQALINLKRHSEAETHLRCVLAAQPENATAHRFFSIVLFEQGRYREADEAIHTAIRLEPGDFRHWYHLAMMFWKQGDNASARKAVARALELNPNDADVLQLHGLCAPPVLANLKENPEHFKQRLEPHYRALELDPENAGLHNNLGVLYQNEARDIENAERCFRRALFHDPTLEVARGNLFLVLRQRDMVYRRLHAPMDWVVKAYGFPKRCWRQNPAAALLLVPAWILFSPFMFGLAVLWLLFGWPMIFVYQTLTIGEIRHQAGEIGARRGGFLGYRRWRLRTRLALFGASLLILWIFVAVGVGRFLLWHVTSFKAFQERLAIFTFCGLAVVLTIRLMQIIRKRRTERHTQKRKQRFEAAAADETKSGH